jgi:pyruvate-ferredoxin/flavodoxin oxidoreductase
MSYGYIYVAQIALGANQVQALRAIHEAEAFPGPSIIIAYAPCISHGIKGGLKNMVSEEKLAVKYGYWHLYRYNPLLAKAGKNPFTLDSPAPSGDLKEFLYKEVRYFF